MQMTGEMDGRGECLNCPGLWLLSSLPSTSWMLLISHLCGLRDPTWDTRCLPFTLRKVECVLLCHWGQQRARAWSATTIQQTSASDWQPYWVCTVIIQPSDYLTSTNSCGCCCFFSFPPDKPYLFMFVKWPVGKNSPCISWAVIIFYMHPISLQQMQDKWASLALLHELIAEQLLQMRLRTVSPDGKIRQLCDSFA